MPNLFDMSKKSDLSSRDESQSNTSNISRVIANNWLIHEPVGQKPHLLGFNNFSSKRKLYNLLKIIFSKILQNNGKRETGR